MSLGFWSNFFLRTGRVMDRKMVEESGFEVIEEKEN
jgi:hypothetical protein